MNCLPVIEMELRSACRRKWTFMLRLLFALTASGVCLVILILPPLSSAQKGHTMLTLISYLSLTFCLFAGGFLTADSVSSEKRDGTLGLLFLTPLRGMDIVLGKLICHGLQMFYGLCALFPLFFLPVLVGGVTWSEVSRTVLALGLALLLGASIGLCVSVFGVESRKTMSATITTIVLIAALPMVYWMLRQIFWPSRAPMQGLPQLSPVFTVFAGFDFNYGRSGGSFLFWGSLLADLALSLALIAVSGSMLGRVFASMGTAVNRLDRNHSLTLHEPGILDRNPYEWALRRTLRQARSLGLLTHVLLVFYALMLAASVVSSHWQAGFVSAFFTAFAIHLLAKLRFAVEATRQISSDRHSGALELLLVSTLPPNSILEGHHRVLAMQAMKPVALLVGLNALLEIFVLLFADTLHMDRESTVMFTTFFLGGMVLAAADFATMRWLALWHGLRAPTHVKAALRSYSALMLLPWAGLGLLIAILSNTQPRVTGMAVLLSFWMFACLLYDAFLVRSASVRLQPGLRHLVSETSP